MALLRAAAKAAGHLLSGTTLPVGTAKGSRIMTREEWLEYLDTIADGPTQDYSTGEILDHWKPTPELRFIERPENRMIGLNTYQTRVYRILQQAWINDDASKKEWRDIPFVDIMDPSTQPGSTNDRNSIEDRPVQRDTSDRDAMADRQPAQKRFRGIPASAGSIQGSSFRPSDFGSRDEYQP